MSIHLMVCVRPVTGLLPSEKLALLAYADSADETTGLAWPGIDAVAEWAGVSGSSAKRLTAALVDKGLLRKYSSGHHGRRARYVVFPNGCCAEHQRPRGDVDLEQPPATVEQLAERLGMRVDATSRPLLEQLLDQQAKGLTGDTQQTAEGSHPQASVSVDGYHVQDPSPSDPNERVLPAAPITPDGYRKGPTGSTRTPSTTTTPPTPHAFGAGGACPAHQPTPADNCRGCGTTPRQLRKAAARDEQLAAAAGRGPRCPRGTPWSSDGTCGCSPGTHPARHELEARAAS
jgi:hypothetical protein